MKQKILIACIVLVGILMSSCDHDNDPAFPDADLINTIYRSLDCTTEQFTDSMAKQGMHIEAVSSTGIGYDNSYRNEYDRINVSINVRNDTITRMILGRSLTKISNPADYYKLLSNAISDYGYADWHGYYGDPAKREMFAEVWNGNYSSAEEASNRSDLYSHLDNEHLEDVDSEQCFAETFTYTHENGSSWRGDLILHGETHFEHGLFEGTGNYVKHINVWFELRRIG